MNPATATIPPAALAHDAAAAYLGIGRTTLYELAKTGEVPAMNIGSARRYRVVDLDAFLAGRVAAGQADRQTSE